MSTVSTMRAGIKSGLTALTTAQQYDALRVEDAFDVAKRRPAVVLVYLGRQKAAGPVGQRTRNKMRYRWSIVFVAENWRDGIGSGTELLDLSDLVDAIRDTQVTTINDDPVYLEFQDDSFSAPPDRPVDGGPAVYITNWVTSEVLS